MAHNVCSHLAWVTFAHVPLARAGYTAKPKVTVLGLRPPVGSHLAIVSVYNLLRGRELIIANGNTIYHMVVFSPFVTEDYS